MLDTKNLVLLTDKVLDTFNTIVKFQDKELYQYNGKYFEPLIKSRIQSLVYQFFIDNGCATQWSIKLCDDITKTIERNSKYKRVDEFDQPTQFININNGVFDIENYKLLPHNESYQFSTIADIDFDNEKTIEDAPNFMNFLETAFTNDDGTPDNETISNIIMLGGYLLYPQNVKESLFVFLGGGANGKSTLIDIFSSFFPSNYVTSLSLKAIASESPFTKESLVRSRLNISGEESGKPIDDENIKKVSSGQIITISRKYKSDVDIKPKCKLLVDSNSLPRFKNMNYGIMRRLVLFEFANTFVPQYEYDKYKNHLEKRVFLLKNRETFFKDIIKEKSAIFNIFIKGLQMLKEIGFNFKVTPNTQRITDIYKENTDIVRHWLEEQYEENIGNSNTDNMVDLKNMHSDFKIYYDSVFPGNQMKHSTILLGRRVQEIFKVQPIRNTNAQEVVSGIQKRTTKTFYNLKVKECEDTQSNN